MSYFRRSSKRSISGNQYSMKQLSGACMGVNNVPNEEMELKKFIFESIIFPFLENQNKFLKEEIFIVNIVRKKLKDFKAININFDIEYYSSIVDVVIDLLNKQELIKKYEGLLIGPDANASFGMLIPRIFLRTDLEIYKIIYNKNDFRKNQHILDAIQYCLTKEIYSIDKIKDRLSALGYL